MFSPAPMRRLQAVVLVRDERAVLCGLGELGALQLTRARAETARDLADERDRCDRLLARIGDLDIPHAEASTAVPTAALDEVEQRLRDIETRATELRRQRQRAQRRRDELAAACERMAPFAGLEITPDGTGRMEFLQLIAGSLPSGRFEALQQAVGDRVALLPLPVRKDRQPLIAVTTRAGRLALDTLFREVGFEPNPFSVLPVDGLAQAGRELERRECEWQALCAEVAPVLAGLEQRLRVERELLEAEGCFARTEATALIAGWVPAAETAAVERQLSDATAGRCAIEWTGPESVPEADVPVLLRPPRLLRPFAMLVEAYGLPTYREIEPTLFLALSYVLMFGMMFGDVGHGAVLVLAGLLLWRRGRQGGLLLVFAGIASIGFGAVYGSYFGLTRLKPYALWRDPMEGSPLAVMGLAVGTGVVMISLGQLLNILNRFRHRDVIGGLLDKFGVAGVVFYWGALALITQYAAIRARGLLPSVVVLCLALPVAGMVLREPIELLRSRRAGRAAEGDTLLGAVTSSFVDAFEAVITFLANTISFVRLGAYAMSHAALLTATFIVAGEIQRSSAAGDLASTLVVVVGNLVAIVLEGLIASIQALRLEFYEFFGKFFSGAGAPFQPFRLSGRSQTTSA